MGIALFLVLLLLCSHSVVYGISLFILSLLFLSYLLVTIHLIISLLVLLVYLGALLILFAYLWMYVTYSERIASYHFLVFVTLIVLDSHSRSSFLCPITELSLPSSFLTFLVCLLFLAMIVVCLLLDFSLGSFRN